jgi:endonuclease G
VKYNSLNRKRCNVAGYPNEKEDPDTQKKIGIQKNFIVGIDKNHLHYTTDTTPGMSGSPIFDNDWNLIGIHHASASKPTTRAFSQWDCENEAVR